MATRLSRVAGKQTLILIHYGRKSGNPYSVKIWFVVEGEKVYIGSANMNHHWTRNVQKTPRVRLSIGDENFDGSARFLTDRSEHERVMALMRRKYSLFRPIYGLEWILNRFRDTRGSFEVTVSE